MSENNVRIQDDLYTYVNQKDLDKLTIPADRASIGGFADLDIGVEKIMMKEFKTLSQDVSKADKVLMKQAVQIYNLVLQDEKIEPKDGLKKLERNLKKIRNIKTLNDFNENLLFLYENDVNLPFEFGVDVDMHNTKKHIITISSPSLILPDKTMYAKDNPQNKALLDVWANMVRNILGFKFEDKKDIEELTQGALNFDGILAKNVKSNEEWANYVAAINTIEFKDATSSLIGVDFASLIKGIYGKTPKQLNSADPKYLKNFAKVFNEKTLHDYVCWAYVKYILKNAQYLGKKLREASRAYYMTLAGIKKNPTSEKFAYRLASSLFSEPVGIYYGRKYFGEEAKQDVIRLVKGLIKAYEQRFKTNYWLGEETKKKAIIKLDKMVLKMGYPDDVNDEYKTIKFKANKDLYTAIKEIKDCKRIYEDGLLFKKVDRSIWGMPGHMVNACYDPSKNDITFPAAILQKPFYSIKQSEAKNYGGIGAVIGHEISHAFDNNGANFDEIGNLNNWWTKKDFAAFKKKTQEMIDEMDGLVVPGVEGKVNGKLVVSESIADLGGVASALQAMENTNNFNYEEFFVNWAKIWAMKATPDYEKMLLVSDVHAPHYWRANKQPQNFEQFYKTFSVKETDKMYLAPEKRVVIW